MATAVIQPLAWGVALKRQKDKKKNELSTAQWDIRATMEVGTENTKNRKEDTTLRVDLGTLSQGGEMDSVFKND